MDELRQTVCETRSYTTEVEIHEHGYAQLLFPLLGSMNLQTAWGQMTVQEGNFLYLPPSCGHSFHSPGRNRFLVLDIPKLYLPPPIQGTAPVPAFMEMDPQWSALMSLLLSEAERPGDASSLSHLIRYVCGKLPRGASPSIEYIHKHYKEVLSVDVLAEMEHYHPNYYAAWFKKTTGLAPAAYIHELRMKEAERLLRETSLSVTVIGEEIGYAYTASFVKAFTRHAGVAPAMYRKNLP